MGVTARLAARRTAVLVTEVPGWAAVRCALEREVRARGWRPADSPADADVLAVCGRPGPRFAAAVGLAWAQLPGPRARVDVHEVATVAAALDGAAAELADAPAQRRDAQSRTGEPSTGVLATDPVEEPAPDDDRSAGQRDEEPPAFDDPGPPDDPDPGTDSDDTGSDDPDPDSDSDDMDMDMGGTDMPMPGGIPLAGAGDDDQLADPDALDLDVLHVPLGPVLPHWPAGLLLHTTLQGDLVVAARAEVLEPADGSAPPGSLHGTPAGRWDAVATLLALAGWADGATAAARLRDAAIEGGALPGDAERWAGRIRRSRLLRWSLRGLGPLPEGDALDRLGHWLAGTERPRSTTLDEVAELVTGLDLAAVRLVVASLDLDTADRTAVPAGAAP